MIVLFRRAAAKLAVQGLEWRERASRFRAWQSAQRRAASGPVSLKPSKDPEISVIIVNGDDERLMERTLRSLPPALARPYEVIVADGSSATSSVAELLHDAFDVARGRFVVVASEGVVFLENSIASLIARLENEKRVAAVVPKVLDGRRRVIEAGMAWRDGTLEPRGTMLAQDDARVSFAASIDASSVALVIRAEALAGRSRPRACDNLACSSADLLQRFRDEGYDALYEPRAVVAFHARAHIVERGAGKRRRMVLVIDEVVPSSDRDAGSKRLISIIRLMRELGYEVVFVPHQGGPQKAAAARLRALGCEVRTHEGDASAVLHHLSAEIVWLARPQIGERYAAYAAALGARVVYDSVDLHHVRLARQEAYLGSPTGWERVADLEMRLIRDADAAIVTSLFEQQLLEARGIASHVIPVMDEPAASVAPYVARGGLLFVGNFTHAPNVEALRELAGVLVGKIAHVLPGVHLDVAGFDPDGVARTFRRADIHVRGHVPDLASCYQQARVFVAPLRFGAGAKGKIIESLSNGLPVVTTSIGAEGLGLEGGREIVIADAADDFAASVARVYADAGVWNELSSRGRIAAARFSEDAVRPVLAGVLESLMVPGASA